MKNNVKTPKNIETPSLRVRGNCLEFQNTSIQLSNISLFSTSNISPEAFPMYSILVILAGVLLSAYKMFWLSIPIFIGGAYWIYRWYSSVAESKRMKRLTIVTNSGDIFPIVFYNQKFLDEVVTVIRAIVQEPNAERNVTINIKECSFSNEASVINNAYGI